MLSLPTGPVKEQLENLITQLNFEAHKAEAVMVDNKEQDQKQIDEYYDSIQKRLTKEKDAFQDQIKKQHREEIKDLRDTETEQLR